MAMKKAPAKKNSPIEYQKGASSKAKKAQGDRMNAQAKSMERSKAKASSASSRRMQAQKNADTKARAARTDAARKKPIKGKPGEYVSTAWKKNQTKKSKIGVLEMIGAMVSPNASVKDTMTGPKGKRKSDIYIRGTYKGKGSK
jgi:hypothetical protein